MAVVDAAEEAVEAEVEAVLAPEEAAAEVQGAPSSEVVAVVAAATAV